MWRPRWIGLLALLAAAGTLAIACGDDEESPPLAPGTIDAGTADGGPAAIGPKEACEIYLRAACDRFVECGLTARCDSLTAYCPDYFFNEAAAYDVESLLACAEQRRNDACDNVRAGIAPPCVRPGKLEAGAPCQFPTQCASGDCSGGLGACGTCSALKVPGTGCPGVGETCGTGRYCLSADAGCVAGPAMARKEGEPCVAGESCTFPTSCLARGASASSGACERTDEGAPCAFVIGSSTRACATGRSCVTRASGPVCLEKAALGDPCNGVSCAEGLYCRSDGVCAAQARADEPCSTADSCAAGLSCATRDGGGGACVAGAGPGRACGAGGLDCAAGLVCVTFPDEDGGQATLCRSRVGAIGEPCAPPAEICAPDLVCVGGTCELATCRGGDGGP